MDTHTLNEAIFHFGFILTLWQICDEVHQFRLSVSSYEFSLTSVSILEIFSRD